MKKRKRLIWVVASATLLAVFVGALFYLATREHPDYVRAAKLLPDARQRAWEVFGALT